MTALFHDGTGPVDVVGDRMKTHLGGPIRALKQGSVGPVLSDLQVMLQSERKQHMDAYGYANGHNDHGLGQ